MSFEPGAREARRQEHVFVFIFFWARETGHKMYMANFETEKPEKQNIRRGNLDFKPEKPENRTCSSWVIFLTERPEEHIVLFVSDFEPGPGKRTYCYAAVVLNERPEKHNIWSPLWVLSREAEEVEHGTEGSLFWDKRPERKTIERPVHSFETDGQNTEHFLSQIWFWDREARETGHVSEKPEHQNMLLFSFDFETNKPEKRTWRI